MDFEPASKTRSRIHDGPEGLVIEIPSRLHVFTALFLTAWLGGWAVGELTAGSSLLSFDFRSPGSWFMLFWLLGWTLGGAFAAFQVLWMIGGQERVTLRPDALVLKKNLSLVSRLRVGEETSGSLLRRQAWQTPGPKTSGLVAFDYGARTIRFGESIDEAEARILVDRLKQRHSFADDTR
jgi:hypothetical protein